MCKSGAVHKLHNIIKCFYYFATISINIDYTRNEIKLIKSKTIITLTIFTIFTVIISYLLLNGELLHKNASTPRRVVEISLLISVISQHFALILTSTYHQETIVKLWNDILNLDVVCKTLDLKYIVNDKLILLTITTCTLSDTVFGFIGIISESNESLRYKIVCTTATITTIVMDFLGYYKFMTLLTMYKNYFKQMNEKLAVILSRHEADLNLLKHFATLHNYFYKLLKDTTTVFSVQLIIIISHGVISTTGYIYNVFMELVSPNPNFLAIVATVYFQILMLIHLSMIIAPSELCMYEVRLLQIYFKLHFSSRIIFLGKENWRSVKKYLQKAKE